MSTFSFTPPTNWRCASCNRELVPRTVSVEYLANTFSVELLVCEECGFVLVPEELALGKMLEVEQLLEDK